MYEAEEPHVDQGTARCSQDGIAFVPPKLSRDVTGIAGPAVLMTCMRAQQRMANVPKRIALAVGEVSCHLIWILTKGLADLSDTCAVFAQRQFEQSTSETDCLAYKQTCCSLEHMRTKTFVISISPRRVLNQDLPDR